MKSVPLVVLARAVNYQTGAENNNVNATWISYVNPNPRAALRLICSPYAGGNSLIFRRWADYLPADVEICTIQLPGRERRLRESPLTQVGELMRPLVPALLPHLDKPFALFGHSMGALVSFELARVLRKEHGLSPLHLFVSGRRAPQCARTEPYTYDLPEPQFLQELRRLNGTPREVLENTELIRLMLPVIRADFALTQTYNYSVEPPLECPISAYGGLQDNDVTADQLEGWHEHTTAEFSSRMLPGDHFFLNTNPAPLLQLLSQELRRASRNALLTSCS